MNQQLPVETDEVKLDFKAHPLLFGLDDRPPLVKALLAAFQHFLAIFVSIITAPLIISVGMGLSPKETSYIISSSLFISGVATLIQVVRIGPFGSRLLCIQGTSFSFIGPLIFASHSLQGMMSSDGILGTIFGSAAVGGLCIMVLSLYLEKLKKIITPTVTGVAVILLGISLVLKTLENLISEYHHVVAANQSTVPLFIMSLGVIMIIIILARRANPWLRLSSISIGLVMGYVYALFTGQLDFSVMDQLPTLFVPELMRYPIGFDLGIFLSLLPIYLVTAAESVGDLTATSALSNLPISGNAYWQRIRRGVMTDGFNSFLASVFGTYPNTTFSQNNGVIQLTGVASRYVGIYVAIFLILFGLLPVAGGVFQIMPRPLLYGATGLMFAMISLSGFRIIRVNRDARRSWTIAIMATIIALGTSFISGQIGGLNPQVRLLLGFPVAVGTFVAIVLELVYPATDMQLAQNEAG